jgi:hypothetical protein
MIRRRSPRARAPGSIGRVLLSMGLAAGSVIVGTAACGGKDGGTPIPLDHLARELATAVCNHLGPCCESAGFPFEREKCRSTYEAELATEFTRSKVEGIAYDASAARRCVDAFAAATQQCQEIDEQQDCQAVFRGIKKEGEPCTSGAECEGRSCRRSQDGTTGTCAGPRLHARVGDPCLATCTQLAGGGTTCSSGGSPGTPPPMNDGMCFTNDGLFCSQAHRCEALLPIGGACRSLADCAGDAHCEQGTCAERTATGPCQTPNACTTSSYCDATAQQCRPRRARGQACLPGECEAEDTCTNGTCQRRTVANERTCAGNF